jgi:anti-anti-sigma factor
MTTVADVGTDAFRTHSSERGQVCFVRLEGCLDMETNPAFIQFLNNLTPVIKSARWTEIAFDFKTLYLMSSCAISSLAGWVTNIEQARAHCRISFHTDPNLKWQARTLDGIRRLSPNQIRVLNV